ncbi:MAG: cytidine deaminase [Candidatus Endobugula sp.]
MVIDRDAMYACFAGAKTGIVFTGMSIDNTQITATYTAGNNRVIRSIFYGDRRFLGRIIVITSND